MSITKYQMFLKTAACGNFSKAAQALNFTQSGVSHAVQSLEEELGVTLLSRNRGGVVLTADGRALLPEIEKLCAAHHALMQSAASLRGMDAGLVKVATFSSVSAQWLPSILKSFGGQYPSIEFDVVTSDFYEQVEEWILKGTVDCGFLRLPSVKRLQTYALHRDELQVILPCNHPLAGSAPFPAAALATEPFIRLEEGISRINVKLRSIDGTEINGRGPEIKKERLKELTDRLCRLQRGDVLFLSGSIPVSVPENIYSTIMQQLKDKGVMIVVDATKDLLMNVLPYHPFLIKPNNHELGEIFGVELKTRQEVVPYGKKLQELGAENVLISMAGEGAVLITKHGAVYKKEAPEGKLVNGVGAGDSMVAGFMAGWLEKQDYEYAFHMGMAAGSASAFSENLATKAEIQAVYEQVTRINLQEQTGGIL